MQTIEENGYCAVSISDHTVMKRSDLVLYGVYAFVFLWSALFLSVIFLLPSRYKEEDDTNEELPRHQILVIGDIGRSPRMQYHAISMGKHGAPVDLIGYLDSDLHPGIYAHSSIKIHPIPKIPSFLKTENRLLFLIFGPLKVLHQLWVLWLILGYRTKPAKGLLVQNPPSIPTLFISQLVCYLRDTSMIIDWHNLAYSILALRLGDPHPLVLIAKWYEKVFSRTATAHLAVSEAMARTLERDFLTQSPLLVLHDRPAESFQPLTPEQRLSFLARLPITSKFVNEIKNQRLRLLVSSTSWTPDEDFSLLLDALVGYSDMATSTHPQLPELMVIITGKGPQKEHYLNKIASLEDQDKLEMVTIETAWLTTEDYAKLLGSADLGVSLHMSSSGIDLPMKVVDMFGAGLPVVGWSKFEAWPELVKEGVNGRGFSSIEELKNVLVNLLGDNKEELQSLRRGALEESKRGWDQEWDSVAGKLFGLN